MKLYLFLVLVLAQTACIETSIPKNDLSRYGYHGPVKQIVSYKYANYTGILDSANFNVRTVFDYNENGNVHFMQLVINRSMMNQESSGINFIYRIRDGKKTGWQEINLNTLDTSYGTIEWTDSTHIFERKYRSDNQVAYEIITELDPKTLGEKVAVVKQYTNGTLIDEKKIENVLKDGEPYQHLHTLRITGLQDTVMRDTVFIEILRRDSLNNATQFIEQHGSGGSKTFIRKDFFYY